MLQVFPKIEWIPEFRTNKQNKNKSWLPYSLTWKLGLTRQNGWDVKQVKFKTEEQHGLNILKYGQLTVYWGLWKFSNACRSFKQVCCSSTIMLTMGGISCLEYAKCTMIFIRCQVLKFD